MRKNKGKGIFFIIVLIAILAGVAVYQILPGSLEQWKQLISFATVIIVTFVLQAIRVLLKR